MHFVNDKCFITNQTIFHSLKLVTVYELTVNLGFSIKKYSFIIPNIGII